VRVLHVIDHGGIGGAQTLLKALLEANRDDPSFFSYVLRDTGLAHLGNGAPNLVLRRTRSRLDLGCFREVSALIRSRNISLLHCHLEKSVLVGLLVKKLLFPDIKLVVHEHGSIDLRRAYAGCLRLLRDEIDHVIAVSEATRARVVQRARIPPERTSVVPNFLGLPPSDAGRAPRRGPAAEIPFAGDRFTIGFLGRLAREKRVDLLVEAFSRLSVPAGLLIGGEGPERRRLEKLARSLGLRDRIRFLGAVSDPRAFFEACDVCAFPSAHESFCMSALEAQACGVPIVVSRVGGFAELLSDDENALLFAPGGSEELRSRIDRLSRDVELRRRIGEAGRAHAEQYSLERFVRRVGRIYASV
jgi:glycosyltransferase involved in cell wall biosynthesis